MNGVPRDLGAQSIADAVYGPRMRTILERLAEVGSIERHSIAKEVIAKICLNAVIILLSFSASVAFGQESNQSFRLSESARAKLQSAIRHEVEAKSLPAFSLALVDADDELWAGGFGFEDAERERAATADTVYRVGSVSKLFTDIAVMQEVEQGRIDLDVSVAEYLPDFRPQNHTDTPITLRQLMSHRSGLVREPPVGHYFDPTEPSIASTVASLNDTALVYPPESRTKYSNAAITVVGRVLENEIGNPFSDILNQRLLAPLGCEASAFELTDQVRQHLATASMWTYDQRRFDAPRFKLGTAPAGNLYASVRDLAKFIRCILHDGKLEDRQILRPESLREMMTPRVGKDGKPESFGLGFVVSEVDGHRAIGHGGAVYGYSTELLVLPDQSLGVAAVAALDGSNGVVGRLAKYALQLALADRTGDTLPDYRISVPVPRARAKSLVGLYGNGDEAFEIDELNGRVFLRRGSLEREVRSAADDGSLVIDDIFGMGSEIELTDENVRIGETTYTRREDALPPPAPEEWQGLIGEYGWDHNTLYILEERGRLVALIEWFYRYPLTEINENEFAFPDFGLYHGEKLIFDRDEEGFAKRVTAAEVVFERREVGTRNGETFKIEPIRPIAELRGDALASQPPREQGDFHDNDLVELVQLDPNIKLDIRYATTNNFTGAVFYQQPRAFMQRPAAEAVVRAHQSLEKYGLGLMIHDAYRPWHVTKMFWDATPDELKDFVANPASGSRHNRGCAVDLTMYDLQSGEPVTMVAGYDEFSPRSFPLYPGGTSRQRWYRHLLRMAMEREGFTVYEYEWWHFDFQGWEKYRIGNATFEELQKAD